MEQATPRPAIALTPIQSSNISGHGYDEASQTLAVQFNSGKVYHYAGVEPGVAKDFADAESKGSFFAKNVRPTFAGVHIEPSTDE
jgi:hypothetical protein